VHFAIGKILPISDLSLWFWKGQDFDCGQSGCGLGVELPTTQTSLQTSLSPRNWSSWSVL